MHCRRRRRTSGAKSRWWRHGARTAIIMRRGASHMLWRRRWWRRRRKSGTSCATAGGSRSGHGRRRRSSGKSTRRRLLLLLLLLLSRRRRSRKPIVARRRGRTGVARHDACFILLLCHLSSFCGSGRRDGGASSVERRQPYVRWEKVLTGILFQNSLEIHYFESKIYFTCPSRYLSVTNAIHTLFRPLRQRRPSRALSSHHHREDHVEKSHRSIHKSIHKKACHSPLLPR